MATMGEQRMWFQGVPQEKEIKVGMAPLPRIEGGNPIQTWSNDRGHYISAQSEDPQACWSWIKLMSEQPTLFSGIPARRSVAESPEWELSVGKEDAAAYRAAQEAFRPVEMPAVEMEMQQLLWPLSNWRYQVVMAAFEGKDVQPVIIAQQQKAEDYLACALPIDTSQTMELVQQEIINCLRQVDPEGNW
jgi:ABC-type glycerol-3-phosphate transport system substrate-binding protein